MSCIHYKFRNHSTYDTVTFDGSSITVGELKQAILGQKKMGRAPDFTLQIINAQTQEEYTGDNTTIPRNADVTVKRIPSGARVSKSQLAAQNNSIDLYKMSETPMPFGVTMEVDLTKTEGTEEDKLKAIMKQQEQAYDQNATTMRMYGRVTKEDDLPPNYVCHRCGKPGHLIKQCPTNGDPSFEQKTYPTSYSSNYTPNYMSNYTPNQPHYIRRINLNLKKQPEKVEKSAEEKRKEELSLQESHDKVKTLSEQIFTNIPTEMECPICKEIMRESSLVSCCGCSFCDECIREKLLDDAECPHCWKTEVYPDTIVPNKSLRMSINNYKKQNSDQIAKIYADCHIRPSQTVPTFSTVPPTFPKPATSLPISIPPPTTFTPTISASSIVTAKLPLPPPGLFGTPPPLSTVTNNMPPVAILPAKDPLPVAILPPPPSTSLTNPIKVESDSPKKSEDDNEKKTILPQIQAFAPLPVTLIPPAPIHVQSHIPIPMPMPQMIPYGMIGPMATALPPPGLLPPPLPLPEHLPHPNEKILNEKEFYAIQEELRRIRKKRRSDSPPPPSYKRLDDSRNTSPDRGWFKQREANKRRQTSIDRFHNRHGERELVEKYWDRAKERPSDHSKSTRSSNSPYSKTSKKHKTPRDHPKSKKEKKHHKRSHKEKRQARLSASSGAINMSNNVSGSVSPHYSQTSPLDIPENVSYPIVPLISYDNSDHSVSQASTPPICQRTPTGPGATTPTIQEEDAVETPGTPEKEAIIEGSLVVASTPPILDVEKMTLSEPLVVVTNGEKAESSSDEEEFKMEAKLPLEELRRRFKEKELEVLKLKSEKAAATERRKQKKTKKLNKEMKKEMKKRKEEAELAERVVSSPLKEEVELVERVVSPPLKENKTPEEKEKKKSHKSNKKSKKAKHSHHHRVEETPKQCSSKRKRSPEESSQDSGIVKVKHHKKTKKSKSTRSKDNDMEIKVKFSPLTIKTANTTSHSTERLSKLSITSPVKNETKRSVQINVSPLKVKTKKHSDSKKAKKHKKSKHKIARHAVSGIEDGEIES